LGVGVVFLGLNLQSKDLYQLLYNYFPILAIMYQPSISLFALPLTLLSLVSATCTSFKPTTDDNIAVALVGVSWMAATVSDISCSPDALTSCSHPQQNFTITVHPKITADDSPNVAISASDAQSIYALAEAEYNFAG
jgi:hypothetical protein